MAIWIPLITLFVHRRSYKKYYKEHDNWVIKQKPGVEKSWNKPFDKLSREIQMQWEETWFWPPWKFNDIVGFLDIGMDIGNCLTADLYIMRKHFPRERRERERFKNKTTLETHQFIYYCEINKRSIDWNDNDTFVIAIKGIIAEAKLYLKKLNKSFRILAPHFDWQCINFIKAAKQAKQRSR